MPSTTKSEPNTTKAEAPTTAAEARALAERLAAAEAEQTRRRRDAANAARVAEAQRVLDVDVPKLDEARDEAGRAWNAAALDPTVGPAELFAAYMALRAATAVRFATVRQAAAVLNQLEPKPAAPGGFVSWREDVNDPYANSGFTDALELVIKSRLDAQRQEATGKVQTAIDTAAREAEAEA